MQDKMNRNKDQRTLTKAEMEIMNILWDGNQKEMAVRDIQERFPEPKPAYTTIATFMKILTQKEFVSARKHDGGGKVLFFRPLISREVYRRRVMQEVKNSFFGGSLKSLVSYFVKEEKLSEQEIDELMAMMKQEL